MGFLTTITVRNDGCDQIKKHPKEFAEKVYRICSGSYNVYDVEGLGFHGNLIIPQKPRHASHDTLYLHSGNTVVNVDDIKEGQDWAIDAAIAECKYQLKKLKDLKKAK